MSFCFLAESHAMSVLIILLREQATVMNKLHAKETAISALRVFPCLNLGNYKYNTSHRTE
jgi:hypothetical protein